MNEPHPFSVEHAFTEAYRRHQHTHPALREAYCLQAQFPAIFLPIRKDDRFAGRIAYKHIGFSPQPHTGGVGYYCDHAALRAIIEAHPLSASDHRAVEAMLDFWRTEETRAKVRAAMPPTLAEALPSDAWTEEPGVVFPLYRMAGANLDYDRLLHRGIPGLRADVTAVRAAATPDSAAFYDALLIALNTLERSALYLAEQADKGGFARIAASLRAIAVYAPETLHQAIQLVYLYTMHATLQCNFGRMDMYLGDFLQHDLETGRTTREEALDDLIGFWRIMPSFEANLERVKFDLRVIIGGRGRRNPENADAFALLALEASDRVRGIVPQLSLRCYTGMNPDVYTRALDLIGSGATFPILYNDDVNIPAVMRAFDIDEAAAEQYVPFGCGEYVIDHRSFGTPNAIINLPKGLEITLRGGVDSITGARMGLSGGSLPDFSTFDDLLAAYQRQVEYFTDAAGEFQALEYRVAGQEAAFLYFSLLYDDCLERGMPMFSGGVRHLGGTYETYGNITAADSLTAIRRWVYEERTIAPEMLLTALDADFEGYAQVREQLLNAPKFGNDDETADAMAVWVLEQVCGVTRAQREKTALDSFLVVVINNSAHILLGKLTAASADGRRAGEPLTNGHTATNGMEKNGVTALLNSMVKLDPTIHAGATHNLKFARSVFTQHRPALEALLQTYFSCGGTQAMITTVNRDDLIAAIEHPEHYAHLIVRVGGFSARFIDLPPETQREIIQRMLWE